MSSKKKKREVIQTKIWREEAEPDNPFAARKCFCAGYDVYGDLLGKISWIEYLYLLFKLEPPTKSQADLLESIAVAIANPGPRDLSVRAAMNAGVGGATSASFLMAAIAPGAGQFTGAREVFLFFKLINICGTDLISWEKELIGYCKSSSLEIWPEIDHVPGFDPYGTSCPLPIVQTLEHLSQIRGCAFVRWLRDNRERLEKNAGGPISTTAIAAAAFYDLGFSENQSEILFLLLRLPGAAAHGLEQLAKGPHKYPFFAGSLILSDDPGPAENHRT